MFCCFPLLTVGDILLPVFFIVRICSSTGVVISRVLTVGATLFSMVLNIQATILVAFSRVLVVMKMVILAQSSNSQNCIKKTNVIPEYAREFKNEYLFIRGINKECGEFLRRIKKLNFNLEDDNKVFNSHQAKSLMGYFRKFIQAKKLGYLNDVEFKDTDVDLILDLRMELYDIIVKLSYCFYFLEFFECFILFYHSFRFY